MRSEQLAKSQQARPQIADVVPIAEGLHQHSLKVCILGYRSHPFGGGQGIYIRYLSKALLEAGHEVDVISGEPYPHLDEGVRLIKMPGLNLFENGLASLRPHHLTSTTNIIEWTSKLTGGFAEPYCFGRRVVKYLRKHGRHYDIIHDNQSLSWGMLQLQDEGFPLVTTIHHPITSDLDIALSAARNAWQRLLIRRWHSFIAMQRKVARQLRNVVTVSECSRQDIAGAFDIAPDTIDLVHCGIDTDVFHPMPDVEKKRYRLMATVSADAPLKGAHYLINALPAVIERFPDLELLLVGKPKPGGSTERLIERLGLSDRIRCVTGISTEELVRYYNEAEVVVVPSVYEGFGLPAGEAMACGTAVVSSNGGALPEVVGDACIQVPVRDSEAIATAVTRLFDDAELREQIARAGRTRMEEIFCWRKAALEMTDFYWKVIDRANR